MPIGKLNDEDRQRLSDHFWAIVLTVCHEHDCWPGEVLNRCRKSHGIKGISPARREIVREMRETVFTYYWQGQCQLLLFASGTTIKTIRMGPKDAIPISFPLLARMLGFDHSALVLAQQKLKKLQENDHA